MHNGADPKGSVLSFYKLMKSQSEGSKGPVVCHIVPA